MQNYTILAAPYETKLTFVPYDPLITLLDTYPNELKICLPKNLLKLGVNQNALQ